jgi:hypothetical protein
MEEGLVPFAYLGALLLLAQTAPDPNLCSLQGTVTDSVTSQKLRKAFVRVAGASGTFLATTDENGSFAIQGLPAGTYDVEVERQGYVGSPSWNAPGSAVQLRLSPGEALKGVTIPLAPQAVITGRVLDEEGDPWIHAQITLYRSRWSHGKRTFASAGGADLNDLGEFRIGELAPGTYFVAAQPDLLWEAEHRPGAKNLSVQSRLTWFPSSLDRDGATPVIVSAGAQVNSILIRLRHGSVYSIRGSVTGGETIPEEQGVFGKRGISALTADGEFNYGGRIFPDGTFEIGNLPSGTYYLRVAQGYPFLKLGGAAVTVEGRDVEGVIVELTPPRPIKGMLRMEGGAPAKMSGRFIELTPAVPYAAGFLPGAPVHDDGSFEFPKAAADRYRVNVSGTGFYVKELRYADAVSSDGTVSLTGPSGDLAITLSAKPARIAGTVSRPADSKGQPQVVLIPKDAVRKARLARFDQNEAFTFEDLPPGSYTVYAFESVPDGAWEDAAFLGEVSSKGAELTLTESETRGLDIPLITKKDLAATLQKLGME